MTTTEQPRIIAPYKPLPWQVAPWRDKSKVVLLTGSAGGGKSRLPAEKVHAFCLKYPGAVNAIIRKTSESLTKTCIFYMRRYVLCDDPSVVFKKQEKTFHYANGSVIFCMGMNDEKAAERLRSMEFDFIWVEEINQLVEDDFDELLGRMRGTAAQWRQLMGGCNPDSPMHWINRRLILGGMAKVYYSSAVDNPYNPPDYIDTLNLLRGVKRLRLRDGKWVQAEGAVYEDFDPAIHVVDRFDIPEYWKRYISVDFGYTNPFAAGWWAEDYDGRLYLYREIYKTKTRVEDHAKLMKTLSKGETIGEIVADTEDAEGRATIERYFMSTVPAKKGPGSIKAGIELVNARLQEQGDERPRLVLLKNSLIERDEGLQNAGKPTCLAEEFPGYRWKKSQDGKPIKEDPVDENNHGLDHARYLVAHKDAIRGRVYHSLEHMRV